MTDISIANRLRIRECGQDEYWLQDQIYDNPSCLDLGELEAVTRERQQSSGGRLDLLLKNPEDDSMYEVEVMLGETDESHIIRTIEYWDNERRRWPQRQHYAVLVAETITRRFFNVIQLFSQSIPIIAIQANIIESNGNRTLYFAKILDTYEEIDDGTADDLRTYDEAFWEEKSPWTLETAKALLESVGDCFDSPSLSYVKSYIAISVHNNVYMSLNKRSAGKSLMAFRISGDLLEQATALLDERNIPYVHKSRRLRITVDQRMIAAHSEMFGELAELVRQTWQR